MHSCVCMYVCMCACISERDQRGMKKSLDDLSLFIIPLCAS